MIDMACLTKPLLIAVSALALTACGDRRAGPSWTQEAGAYLDEGAFGNPTMNNLMAQKCRSRIPKGQIIYEPKIVAAPVGSPAPYIRKAECRGYMNGKYASIVFQEYVAAGTEIPPESQDAIKR